MLVFGIVMLFVFLTTWITKLVGMSMSKKSPKLKFMLKMVLHVFQWPLLS